MSVVSVVFIAVILIFSCAVGYYFYQNGLKNKDSIDILYPCIGAMVLTLFLGFKAVVLDNSPEVQRFDLAILHFIEAGKLRSLPKINPSDTPSTFEAIQNHLYLQDDIIDNFPDVKSQLQIALGELKKGQNLQPALEVQKTISEIIEWQFLRRLFGFGGALDPWSKPILGINRPVIVFSRPNKMNIGHLNDATKNKFLSGESDAFVNLPANINLSKIEVEPDNLFYKESVRGFAIKGKYTTLLVKFSIAGIENFSESDRIQDYASMGQQEIIYYRFHIEIVSNSFTRFSEKAKAERKWMADFVNDTRRYSDWDSVRSIWLRK